MPLTTSLLFAGALVLLMPGRPIHAQETIPEIGANHDLFGPAALGVTGQPRAFGRLFVELEVVSACMVTTDRSVSVRCTRGVAYRARVLNDTDAAYDRASPGDWRAAAASSALVRIKAQRLDVEF